MNKPFNHPWNNYLHARALVIDWLYGGEGDPACTGNFPHIARVLSMTPFQAELIFRRDRAICVPGVAPSEEAARATRDAEDAAKWRALRNSARITAMGSAGLGEIAGARPSAHVTLNFWSIADDAGPEWAREWLDRYVEIAQRAQQTGDTKP